MQVKLFVAFLCVIITAVGINALYVKQDTDQEIGVYEERTEQLFMLRMEHWLLGYFTHGGGWDDVSAYIEEMEVLSGQRIILTDPSGLVIADSQGELLGESFLYEDWPSRPLMQHRRDEPLGMLYISPEPTIETELTRDLAASINYSLLFGSFIAAAVALLLTLVLSRTIAAPLNELSESALKVGKGDFSYQVPVRDKGEFGKLAQAFNRMSDDLARSSLARKHLAADIAHELRSPLTNIRGYVEAMKDSLVSTEEGIEMVDEESAQLTRLINDLQDIALAEAGVLSLNLQMIAVEPLVERVIMHNSAMAKHKGVELQRVSCGQDLTVFGDEGRLYQMFQNLVSNALNHTGSGGTITVSVDNSGSSVQIAVADTGTGIDPDELAHIFDRFYRADPSRSRIKGGTGLGLTITKHLAEAQGGRVEAESMPGKGSCFTVVLPLVHEQGADYSR